MSSAGLLATHARVAYANRSNLSTPSTRFTPFLGEDTFLLSQGAYTTIDFAGSIYTQAKNINAAGEITGGYIDPACSTHGLLLTQGVFTTLDFPGAVFTRASGINPAAISWASTGHVTEECTGFCSGTAVGALLKCQALI